MSEIVGKCRSCTSSTAVGAASVGCSHATTSTVPDGIRASPSVGSVALRLATMAGMVTSGWGWMLLTADLLVGVVAAAGLLLMFLVPRGLVERMLREALRRCVDWRVDGRL
eukprot:3814897-Amphidinium_carterae.1